jgi:Ca-activated chloride channel family protein
VRFSEPARLVLIVLPVALLIAYVIVLRARQKYVVRFTSVDLLESVAPRRPGWQRHIAPAVLVAAVLALVFGFAEPTHGVRIPKKKGTVILAIDTSGSMAATDVSPTRLQAAQDAARRFINGLPAGLQVGVTTFSTHAQTVAFPQADRAGALTAIDSLVSNGGTATGDAIFTSLDAAKAVPKTPDGKTVPAVIVLLSDGSPTIGRDGQEAMETVSEADAAAKQAKIPVDTIAFGTRDGTVQIQGELVPVPADPDTMAEIADETGGKSFTASNAKQLKSVYDQIKTTVGYETHQRDITVWFVGLALVLATMAGIAALVWMQRLL